LEAVLWLLRGFTPDATTAVIYVKDGRDLS